MNSLSYQFAVAQTAYPGFALEQAGDRHVVEAFEQGVLIAVIDGLGHGSKAAQAGIAAADALRQHPDKSAAWLLEHCNRAIRGTRGAAISVVSIQTRQQQLEWAGVGNVLAILGHDAADDKRHETLLAQGGVVGFRMPRLRPVRLAVYPYDTLILTTDGIRSGFMEEAPLHAAPQQLADYILEHYQRGTDDALALVARLFPEQMPIP